MIIHTLFIRLHERSPEALTVAAAELERMRGAIEGLLELTVRREIRANALAPYDLMLTTHFAGLADYERYLQDPLHRAVGARLAPAIAAAASLCAEV